MIATSKTAHVGGVGSNDGGDSTVIGRSKQQQQQQQQQQQPTDMFVACFEAALEEELREQAISSSFRACFEKIDSSYGFIRIEGLREALQMLCDLSAKAAEESVRTAAGKECNSSSGNTSAPHLPYDAIRSSVMSQGGVDPHGAPSCCSETWVRTQRALHGAHYTTALFHRVLVPQMGGRPRDKPLGPVNVELSEEEAIGWNTLCHAQPGAAVAATTTTTTTTTTEIPLSSVWKGKPLDVVLTEVTYQEQELALRLLQGLSLVVYDQRRVIAEGLLIPYAIELWQCFLQHVEALFSQRRRRQAAKKKSEGGSQCSVSPPLEVGPVELAPGLESVMVASIDAVEVACHYNPVALTRIVQQGGVRALLDMGLCPYAPQDIRCAVFDTVSVLMQEVAPFRRAVAAGASQAPPVGGPGNEDELTSVMVKQAMMGGYNRGSTTPSYLMDRASASKFDSAVRDWFSQRGLSHVVSAVMELRDVRGTPIAAGTMPKAEVARIVRRASQLREKRLQALLQAVDGK